MRILLLSAVLFCSSCSSLAVALTPKDVKENVAKIAAVARVAVVDPPREENLVQFLRVNAEAWGAMAIYFGVHKEDWR